MLHKKSRKLILIILLGIFICFIMHLDQTGKTYILKFEASTDKLNEYFRIHERISKQKSSLKKISINSGAAGGYGNKLYSFLSSLVIAILTDSQINLKWKDMPHYIDPPINIFENITYSEGLTDDEFKNKSIHFQARQPWSVKKNVDLLMKTQVPTRGFLRYFYKSIDPLFMEICTNPEYFEKLSYYHLVTNDTVKEAFKVISNKNSTQQDKQERLFKVGFEVGGNLLNRIWRPNKVVTQEIDYYLNKYFKNSFVIGIQLRYGDGNPNQIYLSENDTSKFIECALDIEREYLLNKNFVEFKWFIASDSLASLESILKKYPNKAFTSNGTLAHVAYNSDGYMRTIIDVELLSKCNELIVTGGSTFAWISSMKMQKFPLYINGFSSMSCKRANLSEAPKIPAGYAVF